MARPNDTRRTRRDQLAPGIPVDPVTGAELRSLAFLFLVSAFTMLLVVTFALMQALRVTFVPPIVQVMWSLAWASGGLATWVYGSFVTARARRWRWFALCVIPFTAVPASVAYAWIRRLEIEREVLGPE